LICSLPDNVPRIAGKGETTMTPDELKAELEALETQLESAQATEATTSAEIAELEAADEVNAPPMASPTATIQRIMPTSQFQTPGEGTDRK